MAGGPRNPGDGAHVQRRTAGCPGLPGNRRWTRMNADDRDRSDLPSPAEAGFAKAGGAHAQLRTPNEERRPHVSQPRISCDFHAYRWRHLVEDFFCSLKAFRRVATRYDKTDQSYRAMIHHATALTLR